MWSAKENDGRVFLLINGERAINKQSEELQIKKIFKGKTSNELIVSIGSVLRQNLPNLAFYSFFFFLARCLCAPVRMSTLRG